MTANTAPASRASGVIGGILAGPRPTDGPVLRAEAYPAVWHASCLSPPIDDGSQRSAPRYGRNDMDSDRIEGSGQEGAGTVTEILK